jgi:hypothetical protein
MIVKECLEGNISGVKLNIGDPVDTPICIDQYLWSLVSMIIIQDSHKTICVKNYQESSRNSIRKLSLDLRGVRRFPLGVYLQ